MRFKSLGGEWREGTIQQKLAYAPKSFNVHTSRGKTFRRNQRHIFRVPQHRLTQNMGTNNYHYNDTQDSDDNHKDEYYILPFLNDNHEDQIPQNIDNHDNVNPQRQAVTITRSGRIVKPRTVLDL